MGEKAANNQVQPVTVQPGTVLSVPGGAMVGRLWSSGLCACGEDIGDCIYAAFCPWCHACTLATDMGESSCVPLCVPGWLITLRTLMRTRENIAGSVYDDCVTVTFCGPFAQCQLAREVKRTGMNVQQVMLRQ